MQGNLQLHQIIGHLYIFGAIFLTVYGNLVFKWQVGKGGDLPGGGIDRLSFFLKICLNPWVISGFAATLAAAFCWMVALNRFDLSYAYPFNGLSFALILLFSALCFSEPITLSKIFGVVLIGVGIFVSTR